MSPSRAVAVATVLAPRPPLPPGFAGRVSDRAVSTGADEGWRVIARRSQRLIGSDSKDGTASAHRPGLGSAIVSRVLYSILMLGMAAASKAIAAPPSSVPSDTIVFPSVLSPPTIAGFRFGPDGNVTQVVDVSGASPGRIAMGPDGRLYVLESPAQIAVYAPEAHGEMPLVATIAGPHTGLTGPYAITVDSKGTIYVTNHPENSVVSYVADSAGDVIPTTRIKGNDTGIHWPAGIAVDLKGNIYVANWEGGGITVYPPGSNGNVKPMATIAGGAKDLEKIGAGAVALDASGRVYAFDGGVTIFPPLGNTDAAPVTTIPIPDFGSPRSMTVDSHGNLYVIEDVAPTFSFRSNVLIYSPDNQSKDAKPTAIIAGRKTRLDFPEGVAVDSTGKIYVTQFREILVFRPGSAGNVRPAAKIITRHTQLGQTYGISTGGLVGGIALGPDSKIYVANTKFGPRTCGSVPIYSPKSNGDVPPVAVIEGPHTGIQSPHGIAVDAADNIYVLNLNQQCGKGRNAVPKTNPATRFGPITVYPASAVSKGGGDIPPIARIGSGALTAVAVDSSGKVYATSWLLANVQVFKGSTGNIRSPIATISGSHTHLDSPNAIAVGADGKIYVGNGGFGAHPGTNAGASITIYGAGSHGNVPPIAFIQGKRTALDTPTALAVDHSGYIYVVNNSGRVTVYAPCASGDVAPIASIGQEKWNASVSGIALAPLAPPKKNLPKTSQLSSYPRRSLVIVTGRDRDDGPRCPKRTKWPRQRD
jgi:sugar lactone lactonase YvrE